MRMPIRKRPKPVDAVSDMAQQVSFIVDMLGHSSDLVVRHVSEHAALVFVEPMIDQKALRESLIQPLSKVPAESLLNLPELINAIPVATIAEPGNLESVVDSVAEGKIALVVSGRSVPYLVHLPAHVARQISPPTTEPSIRGPRDAFTENISDNLALVRYRVRNRNLRVRELVVGKETRTRVAVCHIEGKASPETVERVVERLEAIDSPSILDSSYLVPYLANRNWTLLPLAAETERPDRVCSGLLNGRIALLCDGSPFALVMPISLLALFQASEDSFNLAVHSLLLRTVRLLGWLACTMAPALYIGVSSFNPGMLPPSAVMSIADARRGVPYPPIVEVLIMDIALELLSEASVRLPTTVGGAATVVGGLILGTAAAQARLVSNVMIIVVAFTAIGTFVIPGYQNQLSWRLLKYFYTFSAALFGIFGLATAAIIVLVYLCGIDVLGVPYLSPFAPWRWTALLKDSIIRLPQPITDRLGHTQRQEEDEGTADA